MKKICSITCAVAVLLVTGAGCATKNTNTSVVKNDVTPVVTPPPVYEIQPFSWQVFNPELKKQTTISFEYPSNYTITKDEQKNFSRLVIIGPKGRVEIANTAYYDDLPAPEENPTPERQKELETQLPQDQTAYGYQGEFSAYLFYNLSDDATKQELRAIQNSIDIKDLTQQ